MNKALPYWKQGRTPEEKGKEALVWNLYIFRDLNTDWGKKKHINSVYFLSAYYSAEKKMVRHGHLPLQNSVLPRRHTHKGIISLYYSKYHDKPHRVPFFLEGAAVSENSW